MSNTVVFGQRDVALLKLLEMTPATAAHIRKVSVTFEAEPFRDERRVRERLQTLAEEGFVRPFPAAASGGGLMHYYRLTMAGHRLLHPESQDLPPKTIVGEISPTRFLHAMATADCVVHVLVACHTAGVRVARFHGDGKLTLAVGEYRQQPDCHFQLDHSGRQFNLLFEIDNATEPIDSLREQSIRSKLLGYEAYQDWVLSCWHQNGRQESQPRFRVVFLTKSDERAKHILWFAGRIARNADRRLCVATTQDAFLGEPLAVTAPVLIDHRGHWQSLVNAHPSSRVFREPVRLSPPLAPSRLV